MRTIITVDEKLLADAKEFSGIKNTSDVIKKALTLLVQHEAAQRLIMLEAARRIWKIRHADAGTRMALGRVIRSDLLGASLWIELRDRHEPHIFG
ncbi:type II toxin-antitoxin system VapB family antitoxin [Neorhizobium galegae]|nr:type II toxin-antitoxin system VapB family antitoxin [Neorhizobium galegae]